ncbi:MAG: helix-turn-helix transcriptional regulator [Gemmatimonadota bacterium]
MQQGSLYPAVYRLEHQGLLLSERGTSDNGRRTKFYQLTAHGRRRLKEECESWSRLVEAIGAGMNVSPTDVRP